MKWNRVLFAALVLAALLIGTPVGAWWTPYHRPHAIHYYTLLNGHREDVDTTGWTAVFSDTHTTCESATITTLVMAHAAGWPVDAIAPAVLDMGHAFPAISPCSVTLGLR